MIIVIGGPTSSSKTTLAMKLAKEIKAPIIGADSLQFYRDFVIGTGQMTKEEQREYETYMMGFLNPSNNDYSIASYQREFRELYNKLHLKYEHLILVGGSGLYLKAALFPFEFDKEPIEHPEIEALSEVAAYAELLRLDKEEALKIHPHNVRRVKRALAIIQETKMTKSEFIKNQNKDPLYDCLFVGINYERGELYKKIDDRVDAMIDEGFIDEVKDLLKKYPNTELRAYSAIGYREIINYLENKSTYEEMLTEIKNKTHQYAKRQITFFSHQFSMKFYESVDKAVEGVLYGLRK